PSGGPPPPGPSWPPAPGPPPPTTTPRPGRGPAAAPAPDYTGDFSIYPHDDLAVRTWASQIAPAYPWPDKKDKAFGPLWTGWTGTDRTALHTLTLSTLTWGSHAR
ncbi:hypothetical protein ACWGJT_02780, partial [Streptomyces xantholiticus]